jgi:hypothetical protein
MGAVENEFRLSRVIEQVGAPLSWSMAAGALRRTACRCELSLVDVGVAPLARFRRAAERDGGPRATGRVLFV